MMTGADGYKDACLADARRNISAAIAALQNVCETGDAQICNDLVGAIPKLDEVSEQVIKAWVAFEKRVKGARK